MKTGHSAVSHGLVAELFDRRPRRRVVPLAAWILALGGHALAATAALATSGQEPGDAMLDPVDVEFMPPEPPAPEPPPDQPTEEPESEPRRPVAEPEQSPPPPEAAAAGALMTATEDAVDAEPEAELVDFTSDPNSHVYGGGVVAIGGKAKFGRRGAVVDGQGHSPASRSVTRPRPKRRQPSGFVRSADLSRLPRLGEADPCRGFFPSSAYSDTANVSVTVTLLKNGSVSRAQIAGESPQGQGFGRAARSCMLSKRFVPALDRSGNPAATAIRVNVRFRR